MLKPFEIPDPYMVQLVGARSCELVLITTFFSRVDMVWVREFSM